MDNQIKSEKIRELNDVFRKTLIGGRVMMTAGICALPGPTQKAIIKQVTSFEAFTAGNDPYGEHDFGSFEIDGQKVFWKIDTYDQTLSFGSDDPADIGKTVRVLTIMLAQEY